MSVPLEEFAATDKRIPMRELIAGLQQTLHRNHQKILEAARNDWERTYGACDPTDSCASIRITGGAKRKRQRAVISGLN
jgi:hypothetical protein